MALELEVTDVQPGDVLLCYSSMTSQEAQAAGAGYSHTAIALSGERALEASTEGVRAISVVKLLDDYDHIAVLRGEELWSRDRLDLLNEFAALVSGLRFNMRGLAKFSLLKEQRDNNAMDRVEEFFQGAAPEVASIRDAYFFSELTTAAFIHAGIISPSAAVIFTPDTIAPGDIAKDKVFGLFLGYLKPSSCYIVPESDYFQSRV